jgi:hypothetical protein
MKIKVKVEERFCDKIAFKKIKSKKEININARAVKI